MAGIGAFGVSYEVRDSDGSVIVTGIQTLQEAAISAELLRYSERSIRKDAYRPRPMCQAQLRLAATEVLRRSREVDEESPELNYVLVAQRCRKTSERDFELSCLEGTGVSKLWFVLTKDGDLFISKLASDIAHGDALGPVVSSIDTFLAQLGDFDSPAFPSGSDGKRLLMSGTTVAVDAIHRSFPVQRRPEQMRSTSITIELEYENRGPKALMEQLSEYFLQPVANYVVGIKVYKRNRNGPAIAIGRRPFAAVALMWRRGDQPVGSQAQFVEARSFGTSAPSLRYRSNMLAWFASTNCPPCST